MFDLFGLSSFKLAEAQRNVANQVAAIWMVLLDKGICTEEEMRCAIAQATSSIDQMIADERQKAIDDNPEEAKMAEFVDKLLGGSGVM